MIKTKNILLIYLPILVIVSIFIYPNATLVLGIMALLARLALAAHPILQKHQGDRTQIIKEILKFIALLLIISFLGGWWECSLISMWAIGLAW